MAPALAFHSSGIPQLALSSRDTKTDLSGFFGFSQTSLMTLAGPKSRPSSRNYSDRELRRLRGLDGGGSLIAESPSGLPIKISGAAQCANCKALRASISPAFLNFVSAASSTFLTSHPCTAWEHCIPQPTNQSHCQTNC